MLGLRRVVIVGPSMEPGLRNGDWWVARRPVGLRAGDVVVLRHPRRPELLVVKRLSHRVPGGWFVRGDNADASEDSRTFGAVPSADILGRLWFRYGPWPRRPR